MQRILQRLCLCAGLLGSGLPLACAPAPDRDPATTPSTEATPNWSRPVPIQAKEPVHVIEVVRAEKSAPARVAVARPEEHDDPARYGHAPDYHWLSGELRYAEVRKAWCLRYAAEDDDDRYGGRVTLVVTGNLATFRNGQVVRVEGEMIDPDSRDPSPPYRVRSIQPLSGR